MITVSCIGRGTMARHAGDLIVEHGGSIHQCGYNNEVLQEEESWIRSRL